MWLRCACGLPCACACACDVSVLLALLLALPLVPDACGCRCGCVCERCAPARDFVDAVISRVASKAGRLRRRRERKMEPWRRRVCSASAWDGLRCNSNLNHEA